MEQNGIKKNDLKKKSQQPANYCCSAAFALKATDLPREDAFSSESSVSRNKNPAEDGRCLATRALAA